MLKAGDWVVPVVSPEGPDGFVRRVARDGSWADVDWGRWIKRSPTKALQPIATIRRGPGTITDMTREAELSEEERHD